MDLYFIVVLIALCTACSTAEEQGSSHLRRQNQKGEYIYRVHNEYLFNPSAPQIAHLEPYPWEKSTVGNFPKITKEFFRCKGSSLNPVKIDKQNGEVVRHYDCGGSEKHSLPLRDKKEFIYPILIDLLNYIQARAEKKVVITSGHRCPEHNAYIDSSSTNQHSKHMIGAEVSFYVQGMENQPEELIKYIQDYYKTTAKHKGQKDFEEFQRYDKEAANVSIPPWCNKEIFIKLYKKKEGRNLDNRHPYPYISIQVRYDTETQEKVIYTWDRAIHNFLRR